MNGNYTEDSIKKLDPLSFTRLRPDTYLGSNEDSTQLSRELVSNAYDEHLAGNCSHIKFEYDKEKNIITVSDDGQGILPEVYDEDGHSVLEKVYADINVSGKFDKSDDAVYKVSTGAFGIGASLTNYLSHWLIATTSRDGRYEKVYFKEGVFQKREVGDTDAHSGVTVTFNPSEEFFVDPHPNIGKLRQEFFEMSCVCPGLHIELNGEEFYNPDGLPSLIKSLGGTGNIFECHNSRGRQSFDLAIGFTDKSEPIFESFVNYSKIESGAPLTALKTCITKTFNKWGKERGLLDKFTLSGNEIQEGMIVVFNIASPNIRYDSQTKVRCVSTDDNPFINETTEDNLLLWLDSNVDLGKQIIEKGVLARKASEAAKKARQAVKNGKKRADKVKILHPDKLKDAEYLGEDSTLLIVEGLSAGSSMAMARDPKKYGILMLRGKLINAFTNNKDRLMKNEELQLLFKALNQTPYHYDKSKLRYGRVAICVDQDSDGDDIALLIMCAIQEFFPEMIQEGRLCWIQSPLYIVKRNGKEDYYFTDRELDEAKKAGKISGTVQRNKGLGSLTPKQAHDSMFTDNQYMKIIIPDDDGIKLLYNLMGKNVKFRKEYIFDNIDFSEVRE